MNVGQVIARLKGLVQSGETTRDTEVYAEGCLVISIDVDDDGDVEMETE
jgi:hypothetical protein